MSLNAQQVQERMKKKNVVVLDVLAADSFEKIHIRGSENLTYNDSVNFVKNVEAKYGKDKFFITYCANFECSTGPTAAKALKENGFHAEDFPGGIQQWESAGLPIEGTMASHVTKK